jgi:UDP:flavonoid glycosyltransferase YjiC (YdhE family)
MIIPTYSERESNARRIAALGAGDYVLPSSDVTGTKKRVSAEEVRAKVFKILSDGSYTENAGRIRDKMKTYGGPLEAARLIARSV